MSDPTFTYCPICAAHLVEKCIVATLRSTGPECGFILFLDPLLVAVVVVRHEGKYLLGRRTIDPEKDM